VIDLADLLSDSVLPTTQAQEQSPQGAPPLDAQLDRLVQCILNNSFHRNRRDQAQPTSSAHLQFKLSKNLIV
jgi:hypothetical protein